VNFPSAQTSLAGRLIPLFFLEMALENTNGEYFRRREYACIFENCPLPSFTLRHPRPPNVLRPVKYTLTILLQEDDPEAHEMEEEAGGDDPSLKPYNKYGEE